MKKATKRNIKKIVGIISIVITILGALSLLLKVFNHDKDDEMDKVRLSFELGSLNENGEYVDDDLSMYTKKAIECSEYKIELDFESKLMYTLYFYDETGEFVSCTEETNKKCEGVLPENATHMRIVVRSLNDDFNEDGILSWLERQRLETKITVNILETPEETIVPEVEETPTPETE